MAARSRERAFSDGPLPWLLDQMRLARDLVRAYSDPTLVVADKVRAAVDRYFASVVDPAFLTTLAETTESTTCQNFENGVQAKELEMDHRVDREMDRQVSLTGHENLPPKWGRVVLACDCQTLPNKTVGPALAQLAMKRILIEEASLYVGQGVDYSVSVEPVEESLRIALIVHVTLHSSWRSEVIRFEHIFVVGERGEVKCIEKTHVCRVEKIAADALD